MLKTKADIHDDERVVSLLNTRVPPHVRVINGVMDEDPSSPSAVILHGRIDPNTLRFLKVDNEYQRPLGNRSDVFDAIKAGAVVPSIDIGVRGQEFECDGNDYIIKSPTYIIDGWQRVGMALAILEDNPNFPIRLFCTCHFGTDTLWERHRFTELNKNIKKISPNLHLRNMRDQNDAVLTLYGLSTNTRDFPLYRRVSWAQNMKRGDLLTALNMLRATAMLHSHVASANANETAKMAASVARAASQISLTQFRKNIATFFGVVDECWGLHAIEYSKAAPHLKSTFLVQLARMFSGHFDFWSDDQRTLFVTSNQRRKLAKFPVHDPHISNLCGAGGAAKLMLYDLLIRHMNSGKRIGHLRSRYSTQQTA